MTEFVWPDWPARRRPKRWGFAPVWHAAVQANRLLIRERRAHQETRDLLSTSRACQSVSAEALAAANARVRQLVAQLAFLTDAKFDRIVEGQ